MKTVGLKLSFKRWGRRAVMESERETSRFVHQRIVGENR